MLSLAQVSDLKPAHQFINKKHAALPKVCFCDLTYICQMSSR
jgi:hypothetical protein